MSEVGGGGGGVSDLIRSQQSRQAECGHVGAPLFERGGSEHGGNSLEARPSMKHQTDSNSNVHHVAQ